MVKTMKKFYLSNWNYNAALILTELENIIKNNGGRICSTWPTARESYEIVNRSIIGEINNTREKLNRAMAFKRDTTTYHEKLKQLESVDNTPKTVFYGDYLYIRFTLNGKCYYYQLDDNPFFDFMYTKSAIIDDTTNECCYSNNDNKKWWKDIFYSYYCTPADRRAAAEMIFNMLIAAPDSRTYHDKNRKQYKKLYFAEV
jgi:hypothetical protein